MQTQGPKQSSTAIANNKKRGNRPVDRWIETIADRELPALGYTVRSLSEAISSKKTSATDLANTILRDPGMTSTVLRIANSAYYNTGNAEITTVSRAVVMLGFQAIRSLSISVSIMDKMLKGNVRDRQLELMAQSTFAATQSKALAIRRRDPSPEEIFIASLLYNVGEMAFWSFATDEAQKLEYSLRNPRVPRAVAEKEVLGFRMPQLTRELANEWQLGDTLKDALIYNDGKAGPLQARNVVLGHQIEKAARNGWESPLLKSVYFRAASLCDIHVDEAEELIKNTALDAQKTADILDIDLSWRLKTELQPTDGEAQIVKCPQDAAAESKQMPLLQERIISEIERITPEKPDLQMILRMVIEGIYRSSAMDRTLFAILTPDRNHFEVRYVLGDSSDEFKNRFRFSLKDHGFRLFNYILKQHQKPIWLGADQPGLIPSMITEQVLSLTHTDEFFIAPLTLNGRDIGIIYSDRSLTRRPMDADSFKSFIRFSILANSSIKRLGKS